MCEQVKMFHSRDLDAGDLQGEINEWLYLMDNKITVTRVTQSVSSHRRSQMESDYNRLSLMIFYKPTNQKSKSETDLVKC